MIALVIGGGLIALVWFLSRTDDPTLSDTFADIKTAFFNTTGLSGNGEAVELAQQFSAGFAIAFNYTSYEEGLGAWDAWNPNDAKNSGVSVGIIQFNQRKGSLPRLFRTMRTYNAPLFDEIFGPYKNNVLDQKWIKSYETDFNNPDLKTRTIRALNEFKKAQMDVAYQEYFVEIAMKSYNRAASGQEDAYVIYFYNLAVIWGQSSLSKFQGITTVKGLVERAVMISDPIYHKRFQRIYSRMINDGVVSPDGTEPKVKSLEELYAEDMKNTGDEDE